jgi:predicted transcriptional regulator
MSLDPCERYHRGAETSVEAFKSLPVETIREAVFNAIMNCGGFSCEQVEEHLKMPHQTASARITELLAQGRLVITKRLYETRSGRNARVYEAVVGRHTTQTPSPSSLKDGQQQPLFLGGKK